MNCRKLLRGHTRAAKYHQAAKDARKIPAAQGSFHSAPKSFHDRMPRACLIGIYTNCAQPNPTGGSRWIVQAQPTEAGKIHRIPPAEAGGLFNPNLRA
jgi:hypothetical protein